MENILLPSTITFKKGERPNEGVLIVEPCFHGYGTTLGNALRRVLLSSLVGAAVIAVKIKGVTHEFQPIENVKEDALEVILNLKTLRLKMHTDEAVTLKISVSGAKTVTAADIAPNADVEIMNPDLVIAHVTDPKAVFEVELIVRKGRGYASTEERANETYDIGTIAIDALFSPIRNVGYQVVDTRVGDITNYDKLIMNIETDGTISPEEATEQSAQILIDHFSILLKTPLSSHGTEEEPMIK